MMMFDAEEKVSQSRLTVWTSSAFVTDQKPASCGRLRDPRAPVHRTASSQFPEQRMRWTLAPQILVCDPNGVEGFS